MPVPGILFPDQARRASNLKKGSSDEMKSMRVVSGCIALALFCAGCQRTTALSPAEEQTAAKLDWLTNFESAKAKARAENKMVLMDFTGSDWCPPCKMLKKEVFSQPQFADYAAKNLVLLEIDFPRFKKQSDEEQAANEKLAGEFGIEGFPTIVILDPRGKVVGQLGYMPGGPTAFIAALEKLRP
jgi:thioredoxin-related protein